MALYTYSPSDVTVSIAGLHTVTGYVDGTFVRIIKNIRPFETQRAMDGTLERLYHFDEGYRLELTLAQSSPTNNLLSVLHNIDTVSRRMKFPVVIRDGLGQTSFFSGTTWIESIPEVAFSNGMSERTWVFACANAALNIGGNGTTSAVEDSVLLAASVLPVFKDFGLLGG